MDRQRLDPSDSICCPFGSCLFHSPQSLDGRLEAGAGAILPLGLPAMIVEALSLERHFSRPIFTKVYKRP